MKKNISGFNGPTQLPPPTMARDWQKRNEEWWNANPMRYDWKKSIQYAEFSPDFFAEVDRRFIESSRYYLPWKCTPFDQLIDYEKLHNNDVLEIGIGNGTHAQLIAPHARSFTGIDITEYAVTSAMRRLGTHANLRILRMDAEHLDFPECSFDFVWSWGVIHHSSNTQKILQEISCVLRPGGRAIIMVYHRGWFNYYMIGSFVYGVLMGGFMKKKSLHTLIQEHTDGAIARYYTPLDFSKLLPPSLTAESYRVMGQKNEILPIPGGRIKSIMLSAIPDAVARIFTHRLRGGSFLVVTLKKQ